MSPPIKTFSSGDFHYKFYLNIDYRIPDAAWYNQQDESELRRLLSDYRRIIALHETLLTRMPPFKEGDPHVGGQIVWHTQVHALVAKADGWRHHLEEIVLLFDKEYRVLRLWLNWCLCMTSADGDMPEGYEKLVNETRKTSDAIQKSRSSQPTFPWESTCCPSGAPELAIGDQ
ncbi:MAG: hypothetical protein Q9184_002335 [Pyrenodesmia sp. 2 TL-2023]